jgi:hypothetical protein
MEAQLHRRRQACSAHRRRVEGARLILEIDIRERLSDVIADREAGVLLLDRPRRREAAFCHVALSH